MATLIETLTQCVTAAGGLGAASFALVDATKAVGGGISNAGFGHIERVLEGYFDGVEHRSEQLSLGWPQIRATLRANWLNGTALNDQKAIAKSLLKLRLTPANAALCAERTQVDAPVLTRVANKIASGGAMTDEENDVWGRFDLMLTAQLDQGYQRADQAYRNYAKGLSMVVSVALALIGQASYPDAFHSYQVALLVGLAATPVAPIAKDLTTALAATAKVFQSMRR